MKKLSLALMVAVAALAVAGSAFAYTGNYVGGTGINGTPHDLSTLNQQATSMSYPGNAADTTGRICIFCHAPHNTYRLSTATGGLGPQADAAYNYLPLWNHLLPTTVPVYTMYTNGPGAPQTGPKAAQSIGASQPGNVSLLCLSCHDGSIAVNSYGSVGYQPANSVNRGSATMANSYQIGGNGYYLGNHHPIGFNYETVASADNEINPSNFMLTASSTIKDHLFGNAGAPGMNVNLECASCHSVHNTGNPGAEKLLWRSDQNSELCLTCHAKGTYTIP